MTKDIRREALEAALTPAQVALKKKHGDPGEFASAVYAAVPGDISMDEARAAVDEYNRKWAAAGDAGAVDCRLRVNNVYLGDCLVLMKAIPDDSIDLVLCDLPFGITSNQWDCLISLDKLWEEYLRIGKQTCVFALNSCQPFTSILVQSNINLWRHEWVWIKNRGSNFANTVREPFKEHETIQIFCRGKWVFNKQMQPRTGAGASRVKYKLNQTTKSTNYREFASKLGTTQGELRVPSSWQKWNTDTSGLHPTIKPLEMGEYFVKTYTHPSATVLDNCCGSGTYCLAAKNLGRNFIGIEKESNYFEIAKKRLGLNADDHR